MCWSSGMWPATSSSFEKVSLGPRRLVVTEWLLIQRVVLPSWYARCNIPCVHSSLECTCRHDFCAHNHLLMSLHSLLFSRNSASMLSFTMNQIWHVHGNQCMSTVVNKYSHLPNVIWHTSPAEQRKDLRRVHHTSTYNSHKHTYVCWWNVKRMAQAAKSSGFKNYHQMLWGCSLHSRIMCSFWWSCLINSKFVMKFFRSPYNVTLSSSLYYLWSLDARQSPLSLRPGELRATTEVKIGMEWQKQRPAMSHEVTLGEVKIYMQEKYWRKLICLKARRARHSPPRIWYTCALHVNCSN